MFDTLLDPERRQKAAEDQAKFEAVLGRRVARQPGQVNYQFGLSRERAALDQLSLLGPDANKETFPALFAQLAEALALQAKYEDAIAVAPEGPHKEEYIAKAKAVEHVNEQQCNDPLSRDDGHGRQEATQLTSEKVFNGKVLITFTKCLECGAISAYA